MKKTFLIVFAIISLLAVSFLWYLGVQDRQEMKRIAELYSRFTPEQYQDLANGIEKNIRVGNYKYIDSVADINYYRQRLLNEMNLDAASRAEMQRMRFIRPGKEVKGLQYGGYFDLMNITYKNGTPYLLFRILQGDYLDYLEYRLGITKGKLVVRDRFWYSNGNSWGEDVDILINEIGSMKIIGNAVERNQPYIRMVNNRSKIVRSINSGDYEKGQKYYDEMPDKYKDYVGNKILELMVKVGFSDGSYEKASQEFEDDYPELKSVKGYHDLMFALKERDTLLGMNAINDLKEGVGDDFAHDFVLGRIYSRTTDYKKAAEQFHKSYTTNSDFKDGLIRELDAHLSGKDYAAATLLLKELSSKNWFSRNAISEIIKEYPEYRESSSFKSFINET